MIRIGVDTGGTFTDLVMLGSGGMSVHKVRSTPDDPSRAILDGIRDLAGATTGGDIVHGSTVATNAVLERKGARVGVVATAVTSDAFRRAASAASSSGSTAQRISPLALTRSRTPNVNPFATSG